MKYFGSLSLSHDHIAFLCCVGSESGHTFKLFYTGGVVTMDTPHLGTFLLI